MHHKVAVATILVCLVTPLFSAVYAQSCPPPSPPAITLQNAEICAYATDTASTPSGMASYSWSITHGSVVSSDQSGNVTFTSDGSGDVVLSVTATDTNGCPATNSVTVPLHSIVSPTITAPALMCPSGSGADISVSDPASGGSWLSVQWDTTNGYFYNPNTYPYQSTSATGAAVHVYPDGTGQPVTLHVRVTDNQYCMADATTTIGVRTIAAPVITAPAQVCPQGSGGDLSIADPAEGGMWSYVNWDVTNGYFYNPNTYPYQSTYATGTMVHFYPDGSGQPISVRVRAFDGQNCMSEATTSIGMRSIAPPVITAPAQVCPQGSGGDLSVADPAEGGMWSYVNWDVTNGYFYNPNTYPYQSNSATGSMVHFYPDGSGQPITVRVRAFDGQNCMSEATTTIGMRSIAPPVINAPAQVCPQGSGGDLSVADPAEGGMWSYVNWDVTNAYFYNPNTYPYQTTYATGTMVHFYPDGSGQTITVRVRAFDGQNCMSESTTTITMSTVNPPDIHLQTPDICPSNGFNQASIDNPASGYWSSVTWSIDHGTITSSVYSQSVYFTGDGSGIAPVLHVTVQDDRGCSATNSATVTIRSITAPDIHLLTPDICPSNGFNQASVDNPASGYWSTVTWSIDHGTITNSVYGQSVYFTGDGSGVAPVLHVQVQDDHGCTATNSVTVSVRSIPAPDIHLLTPDICPSNGFNQASIDNPASGYWSTVTWSIDHGTITNSVYGQSVYFTGDGSGIAPVLHVAVQDDRGCTATSSATVSIRSITAPDIHLLTPDICPSNGFNQASIDNPASGYWSTVTWSIDHGTITNSVYGQSVYFTGDGSGIAPVLHVAVQDDRGCTATNSATVSIRSITAPDIHLQTPDICPSNGYNQASIDNPSSGYWTTITWSIDHGSITSNANSQSIYFTSDGSGIAPVLHVAVQDDGGCTATNDATVSIRTVPPPVIAYPSSICVNSNAIATVTPATGYSWSWSIANGTITGVYDAQGQPNPNGSQVDFQPSAPGQTVLTATQTDPSGCTSASSSVTVNVTAAIPTDFTVGSVCPGSTGTASAANNYSGYSWTIQNGTILSGANAHTVTFRASNDLANPTVLTFIGAGACNAPVTKTVPWTVLNNPQVLGNTTVCPLGNGSEIVSGNWSSYAWSISNGTITSSTTSDFVNFTAGSTGNVVLTLTVTYNGCTNTSTVTVPIEDTTPPAITAPDTICYLGTFTASVPAGYDHYAWWYDNVTEVSVPLNSRSIMLRSDGTGRPIDLRVTMWRDSGAQCQVVATKTVTYAATPTPTIGFNVPPNFCTGMTGQASVTNGPYTSYLWTITGGTISGSATGSSVSFIPDGSATPQLTVRVTDGRGDCYATGFGVSPFANFKPSISSSNGTDICSSATTTLGVYGSATPDSYLWSTGATTPTITVNTAGDYTVTTTMNGCSMTSAPLHINVHTATATISADKTSYCAGASPATLTLTNFTGINGQARYIYWYATDSQFTIGGGYQVYSHTASSYTRTYYAVISDENGCSAQSNQITITVNPLPTPTISASGPTTFCAGGSVTLTASAASTYLWSNGATTQAITVNASGNYSVAVTDANGCSGTSAATSLTVNPLPTPTVSASGATTFCAGGSVTLTASSASSYLWSNGATTQAITVNASGNYSVTVTNANGCSATSAATAVTVNPLPTPTINASGPTTFCAGGNVTLTASSASSYLWSNGATTQAIAVNTSGNYSVTVTDANGCSATSAATSVVVDSLAAPVITFNVPSFCPETDVVATVPAGYASYTWSASAGLLTTGQGTNSFTISHPGAADLTVSVTVTDANGCSATSTATLPVRNFPKPTINLDATRTCLNGVVHATASDGPYTNYLWFVSNGTIISGDHTSAIAFSPNGTGLMTVSLTVNGTDSCFGYADEVSVTVDVPDATISASGPTTFCAGGSVTLTASSASSYLWSNGATTQAITVNASGNYSVAVTDANGCSATSAETAVTVNQPVKPTISADGPTTFCDSSKVTLTSSAANSYLWSNGATTSSITVTTSGSYSVTTFDSNGCSSTSDPVVVTVDPPLAQPTATAQGSTSICPGGSVTMTVTPNGGGNGVYSYQWYAPTGPISGATSATYTASPSSSTYYSAAVFDSLGCGSTSSNPINVTVNSNPSPSITAPAAICAGATGSASTAAISGASYAWTIANGTITGGNGTNAITFTSASGPVTLGVTVTSSSNCSGTASATVGVNALPNATITAPAAICSGASAAASVASVAGATYNWTITNGTITGGSGTSAITFTATTGPVSLDVTVTSNGCSSAGSTSVTVNALPNATITAPAAICSGSTGSASVTSISGGTYSWSIGGGTITGGSGTNAITFTSTGSNVSLSITVTNSNGCSASSSANVAVNANPATPSITPGGPTTFCAGGSVTLTAPAASSYHWSNGLTTQAISVSSNGTFWVTVTNASGCTSAQSAPVTVTVNPATAITQQPASITIPHNTTTTLSVTATGTGTLTYQWYNPPTANNNDTSRKVGTNSPTFTTPKLNHGTYYYYVVVTGSCGTVRSSIATVTSN